MPSGVSGRRRLHSACATAAIALIAPSPATAASDTGPLRLELNKLEPQGGACRTYLLIDNAKGEALRSLKVDLFALDAKGVAQRRIAVEVGPVPAHKTLIKLFDFANVDCRQVGRVLLNDVMACTGASGPREDCLARIETVSKVDQVTFVK